MKKELLKKVKEEAKKVQGNVAAYFVPNKTKGISHCEIRIRDNFGDYNRGFILHLKDGKVHNGELFDNKIKGLLFHAFENETKAVVKRKIAMKGFNVMLEIRPSEKKVRYYLNGKMIFALRKVRQEDDTFGVSEKSLDKARTVVELEMIKRFRTTPNDFALCRDLIEAVVNYLIA